MFELFLGAILLGLTTALTAMITLYPAIFAKAIKLKPNGGLAKSFSTRSLAKLACFLFTFIAFPLMMIVLFENTTNQAFSEHLSETLSQA